MAGDNSSAALRLAVSLAGSERALLLVERFGTARIEAATCPEGDRLAELVGCFTAPTLETLASRIQQVGSSFAFTLNGGRGSLLLPGIEAATIPERSREQLQLLAAAIAESLDERATFDYADELSEGLTIYRFPAGEPEIESINRSAAERLRATPQEVLSAPRRIFQSSENRRLALSALERARSGDDSPHEVRVRALNGAYYWVQIRALPLAEIDGVKRILLITSDITFTRATAERERTLAACIDAAADAIAIYRMDRRTRQPESRVYANEAFCAITNVDEILDLAIASLDEATVFQAELNVGMGNERNAIPMDIRARYLRGETGDVDFVTLSLRDLSERLAGERQRNMLSRAVDESLDFFAIGDFVPPSRGGSHILYMNTAFAHLVGYSTEELIGRSSGVLISPNNTPQALKTLAESIEHRKVVNLELMMRAKDGRDIWCEFVAQPIVDDSAEGGYWLTVGREITLRKQAMGQIALLTWVLDEIDARVTIFEPAKGEKFVVSYENAASAELGRYHFLDLVRGGGIVGKLIKDRKFAESPLRTMAADADGKRVTEIEIRALFDGAGRLAAVITMERDIAPTGGTDGYPSAVRLALVTAGMQNMIHAPSPKARLRALSLTLSEGFGASISVERDPEGGAFGLTFEPQHRRATLRYFSGEPKRAHVTWNSPLGDSELTTLRLALETFLGAVQVPQ
ncbi:MAG: PAS domain-containing protein [Candidatus Baltobacteraceae bacterium]